MAVKRTFGRVCVQVWEGLLSVRTVTGAAGLAVVAALAAGCADTTPPSRAAAAPPARCGDERFPIYFAPGSAELQPDSAAVIRSAAKRVGGCRIAGVEVTGVAAADAAGRATDPALTQRRSDGVAAALAGAGLPSPSFDVQVTGAAAATHGVRTPLIRRTEVVIRAGPAD